ncbi:MAG TPA: hypothetical protein DCE47_22200 [Planctomycetaceae bacterium]|nr:hypothetical protein [Planctomycetaceae bacterium]HCD01010.1 hypothetical protein [Planctomycetaceae bacterium]|tara:strand:- start:3001 stop:4290 length:1290 start_codon:yes stop_codon:yes gene_type:complete
MTTEFPVIVEPPEYTCPGHSHPISRSIHLSRLAAFYPACRECPHRDDTGGLAGRTIDRLVRTRRRVARATLFTAEGVRGVHRNELTRTDADRLVAALAWLCWRDRPRTLVPDLQSAPGPVVVVGHDMRPAARDLLAGVLSALVRSGCRAVEVGPVSDACFRFAVNHLEADAGIRVTGDGHPSWWIGLDAVAAGGRPLSRGAGLDAWETAAGSRHPRPTRQAGSRRSFQATEVYQATLKRHLLASRPLEIGLSAPEGPERHSLSQLLEPLPWTLHQVDAPATDNPRRISGQAGPDAFDVGLAWSNDRDGTLFYDETGAPIDPTALFMLLAKGILPDHPGKPVVLAQRHPDELTSTIRQLGGRPRSFSGTSRAETWQALRDHEAVIGIDDEGNAWCGESAPTQDRLLIIAHLLRILDRHDRPLSQLLARND